MYTNQNIIQNQYFNNKINYPNYQSNYHFNNNIQLNNNNCIYNRNIIYIPIQSQNNIYPNNYIQLNRVISN